MTIKIKYIPTRYIIGFHSNKINSLVDWQEARNPIIYQLN